ncbi:unnamed protein product [Urochloa humidicola]
MTMARRKITTKASMSDWSHIGGMFVAFRCAGKDNGLGRPLRHEDSLHTTMDLMFCMCFLFCSFWGKGLPRFMILA